MFIGKHYQITLSTEQTNLAAYMLYSWILRLLLCVNGIVALGLIIPPIKVGDKGSYASLKNTVNCVKYKSNKDDIVFITLKTGDRQHNQMLDVIVLDEQNNNLRQLTDVSNDINIIFSNMNGENELDQEIALKRGEKRDLVESSDFYICFNNIFTDKSWSFQPQPKELELFVDIKNMTTIKQYNYKSLGKYFNRLKFEHYDQDQDDQQKINNLGEEQIKPKKMVPLKHVFSESDWINEINFLSTELNNIVASLKESEMILTDLSQQEVSLRNVNEDIFSNYTKTVIALYVIICVIGALQLLYYRWLLKKRKVLT